MLFLISLAIAIIFSCCCDKILKKHPVPCYITAAVLTAAVILISQLELVKDPFIRNSVLGIFSRGALGGAFWAVVMFAGALPNGSAPIKKLMPIRGELSIMAATITLSHIITYGMKYITSIINNRMGTGSAFTEFVVTCIISLVLVLIMVPLTIMSFKTIRKKIDPKKWKKIQRFAYLFYALIYAHIMVLFVPKANRGIEGYFFSIIVYTAVFAAYAAMRIRKAYIQKKKPEKTGVITAVCAVAAAAAVGCAALVSMKDKETASHTTSTTVSVQTTEAVTEAVTTAEDDEDPAVTTSDSKKKKSSSETTETTSADTSETTETTSEGEETTEAENEEGSAGEESAPEENNEPEQPQENTPEPEPSYIYKNGTFEGKAYGYDGDVGVTITIENDRITKIDAWSEESDLAYFDSAVGSVVNAIISSQSTSVDAVSGATYSSNAIMEAVAKALDSARN